MFKIQYLIYLYITLCVAMMIFNVFYMIYFNSRKKKIQKRNKALIRKIDSQIKLLESGLYVSKKHRKYLEQKLQNISNLYILEDALEIHKKEYTQKYIDENKAVFRELCKTYLKKDTVAKAYFAYILGKYKIGGNKPKTPITNYLFAMLEEESLYCVDNALIAFYRLGNLDNIIEAIEIIDKREVYQNTNIILKGMFAYEGSQEEMALRLWDKFDTFGYNVKIAIINYISIISKGEWNDTIYNLLKKGTLNKELKIAIINYFSKHHDERVQDILYQIVELPTLNNIEYIIATIKALVNYPGENTIQVLKKVILQKNHWNIQVEASKALNDLGLNYIQLIDIYNGENQKARNILKYISKRQKNNKIAV